jgi:hypothetical protein
MPFETISSRHSPFLHPLTRHFFTPHSPFLHPLTHHFFALSLTISSSGEDYLPTILYCMCSHCILPVLILYSHFKIDRPVHTTYRFFLRRGLSAPHPILYVLTLYPSCTHTVLPLQGNEVDIGQCILLTISSSGEDSAYYLPFLPPARTICPPSYTVCTHTVSFLYSYCGHTSKVDRPVHTTYHFFLQRGRSAHHPCASAVASPNRRPRGG